MSELDKTRVYDTYDQETDAKLAAQRLHKAGRRASVRRVIEMALANDPLTPRTAKQWCVLTKGRP